MFSGREIFPGDSLAEFTQDPTTAVITETLAFGFFSLLILVSTYHLIQRGAESTATKSMLLITIMMYAVAATHWASRLRFFYMLVGPKVYEFEEVFYSVPNQCLPTVLLIVNILLSDAVVLWRAWILWSRNRYVQGLSAILLISTLALSAHNARTICATTNFDDLVPEVQNSVTVSDDPYGTAAFALSLCTNLWSTSLVAHKAWRHWRTVKAHLQTGNIRTRTEKVMSLLLESGTVYGLLWIFVVGYTFDNVTVENANTTGLRNAGDNFVKGALIQLVGIYPTLVIVLVCLERSHCDRHFTDLPPVPIRPEINLRRVTMATSASRARESSVFVIDRGEYNSSEISSTLVDETQKASDVGMAGTV